MLVDAVQIAFISTRQAYYHLTKMYNIIGSMSAEDFTQLVDRSNSTGLILFGHFLAFHCVAQPVIAYESSHRDITVLMIRFIWWINDIHGCLSPAMRQLLEWPRNFIKDFMRDVYGVY